MIRGLIKSSVMGLGLVAAGCGGGGEDVDVTLQEFAVGTDRSSVSAGSVTFNIENKGPDDTHEFVVLRTDLDPTGLPTDETALLRWLKPGRSGPIRPGTYQITSASSANASARRAVGRTSVPRS
jgi:hypothetical protein